MKNDDSEKVGRLQAAPHKKRIYKTKVCLRCGKEYQPTNSIQKYCRECGPTVEAEMHKVSNDRFYKKNPEYYKKWRKTNPNKVGAENTRPRKANHAKWEKLHPERNAIKSGKRRDAKYANTPLDEMLTSTEWLAILAEASGHCHYCDKEAKLTLDHVVPLSRSGKHSKDNVVAACSHCNNSKSNKTLEEWNAPARQWVAKETL